MTTATDSEKDARSVITLRDLEKEGNFFANSMDKWKYIAKYIISAKNPREMFGNFLFSTIDGSDREKFSPDELVKIFEKEVKNVKNDIEKEVENYLPLYWFEKQSTSIEDDPLKLLAKIRTIDAIEAPLKKEQFEALRAIEMAMFYFYISARYSQWVKSSLGKSKELIKMFLEWLCPNYSLKEVKLSIQLNPKNKWRYQDNPNKHSVNVYKGVWQATLSTYFNKKVSILVDARLKNGFTAFAKRFRQEQQAQVEIWPDLPDLFGIRLIHQNEKEMKEWLELIRLKAVMSPNPVVKYCHTTNKHSQKRLKIKNQRIFVNGRHSEIQHILLRDWANIEYSISTENHTRYHLRWFSDPDQGVFFHIFPKEIYGKDWSDPKITQELNLSLIRKLREKNLKLA